MFIAKTEREHTGQHPLDLPYIDDAVLPAHTFFPRDLSLGLFSSGCLLPPRTLPEGLVTVFTLSKDLGALPYLSFWLPSLAMDSVN